MRVITTLGLIGWGAAAFGAPYPWAYVPLFSLCLVAGLAGLLRGRSPGAGVAIVAVALACVATAMSLQLVPISPSMIHTISPETDAFLQRYSVSYGLAPQAHPLSIDPPATQLALVAFVALSVFLLGAVRSFTSEDVRRIAAGVGFIGVGLSVVGIVQAATWNGKLYGFWRPEQPGTAFGPFNNHNHFAGWMLMAIPLSVGYLSGRLARRKWRVKPGLRNRLLWLASPEASQVALSAFAVLVMAIALALTRSRSGLIGLVMAMVLSGWSAIRRPSTGMSRRLVAAYLAFVVVAAIAWTGVDRLAPSFSAEKMSTLGLRIPAWGDAWRIARRFPLVGSGVNTYGTATIFFQTVDLSVHYAEAHNDYLQLLAEGGFLVGVPVILAIVTCAVAIRRRFRDAVDGSMDEWIRRGATTGLLAIGLQETADFSLQMPGNAVLFVVLVAVVLRSPSR